MANRKWLTDEEVEQEIKQLKQSEFVKLAEKEIRVRYKRRKYLYALRNREMHGKELAAAGITWEMLDAIDREAGDIE